MINPDKTIYYTDGWHPTVNPSSRMVIHHYRFIELLQTRSGVLNEFPRRKGGSTLRFMRFDGNNFSLLALPTPFEYVPWWLPASSDNANAYLYPCFDQALQHRELLTPGEMETIETIRDQLHAVVNASSDATLGEALNNVNEQIYRTILSGLPKLNLISFTKCPIRHSFASAARAGFGTARISAALALWASQDGSSGYPMLAVGRTSRGFPCRVSWLQNDQRYTIATFDPLSGSPTSVPEEVDVNWLIDALDSGTIIPGSRLASLLEVALRQTGVSVKHFGNNYGRLQQAAALFQRLDGSEAPWEDILICEDDEDSWLVAEVRGESLSYPIHLMDMLLTKAESSATMQGYVDTSLNQRAPVVLRPRSTLGETILDRRP